MVLFYVCLPARLQRVVQRAVNSTNVVKKKKVLLIAHQYKRTKGFLLETLFHCTANKLYAQQHLGIVMSVSASLLAGIHVCILCHRHLGHIITENTRRSWKTTQNSLSWNPGYQHRQCDGLPPLWQHQEKLAKEDTVASPGHSTVGHRLWLLDLCLCLSTEEKQ